MQIVDFIIKRQKKFLIEFYGPRTGHVGRPKI